ncbi:MAG TPA: primary-amine oxidase [Bryobacteraceae bacterium]|nr:primary-amine oxidase [Bryobacteraceae bacterium]
MRVTLLLLILVNFECAAGIHPLTPLSAPEIQNAVAIFRRSGRMPSSGGFSLIALDEPPKELVLRGAELPRRAFAVIYDRAANRTFEGIADLSSGQVASWKEVPGAQPPVGEVDSGIADRIVRADPRWRECLRVRGIRDPNTVVTVAWPAGYFGLPGDDDGRIVRVTPYLISGQNYYAHPVEGVAVHVNLTTGKVVDFLDIDRNAPISRENADLHPGATGPFRQAPAPLQITQPNGPGFQIEDGEVRWQKWRFRYALHPREGLVLYTVGYEDGGRVRSILYRGSLSEMVVPYGDPGGAWFFRNSFDAGELGLGILASSLRAGVDCPQNCTLFDAVVADESGQPRTIPHAVALFERDAGVAWKHGDNARRARDLVLSFQSEAGNYEYGFEWIFHQDGSLEMQVLLSGIMSVKGVPDGASEPYSHLVAKNIAAVHHQHFFSFRLDLDVDGGANRVMEMNSVPVPAGQRNPYGGAFTMEMTTLDTERKAQRRMNLESSRRWIVENPAVKNALGQPTGYALLPGENAVPFLLPDSWVRKRAGFLNAHVWVTPYNAAEMHAAGEYPYQSKGGDGLLKWTAADRPIDNRDVVLWYTMGITHNPRPEDWPVMPTLAAGFKLVPWGFFVRNPALDIPPGR